MKTSNNAGQQDIEVLRQRYDSLREQRITADNNLKHAREQLEQLCAEAHKEFGTDDLKTLEAKLAAMREDNEKKRAAYQEHLDGIERDLAALETGEGAPAAEDGAP